MSREKSFLTIVVIVVLLCLAFGSTAPSGRIYYLSLGDSYAAGVESTPKGTISPAFSYADALYELLKKDYSNLELIKYGCSGATSEDIINQDRCNAKNKDYSQLDQAVDFMNSNKGMVKFVTIIIGTNDLHKCGNDDSCISKVLEDISNSLTNIIIPKLKEAGGEGVQYAGSTYYNPSRNLLDDRLFLIYDVNGFKVADMRSTFSTNGFSAEYQKRVCLYTDSCKEYHNDHPNVLGSREIGALHYSVLVEG